MIYVITAGGTSEPIDRVRKITNMSKGTLGIEIAKKALLLETTAKVYFLAPGTVKTGIDDQRFVPVPVSSTQEVHDALQHLLTAKERVDAVIHSMAISDYTLDYVFDMKELAVKLEAMQSNGVYFTQEDYEKVLQEGHFRIDNSSKISSNNDSLTIKLKKTEKIISKLKGWSPKTLLMGFKLLENVSVEELLSVARAQKEKNNCDFVFANDIAKIRTNGHQGHLLFPDGQVKSIVGLENIAQQIIDAVEERGSLHV